MLKKNGKGANDPKQIVPNEDTAPVVQRIFALFTSGFGLRPPTTISSKLMFVGRI